MNPKKLIKKNLVKFLPAENIEPKVLHKAMRYSVLSGGKRIRPVILIETAIACGGTPEEAVAAACAIEFVHTYSLIHDDLPSMDNDDYRRGKPSCHKKFGEANAILAGDALLTLAFNVLAEEYSPSTGARMIKILSLAIGSLGMVGGQALDIAKNKDSENVNFLKTAKLFEAAATLGALSAKANKEKIASARKYGINVGMAFQAVDDVLDKKSKVALNSVSLIRKAKRSLNMFGRKADVLKEIADNVLIPLASLRGGTKGRRSNLKKESAKPPRKGIASGALHPRNDEIG